MMLHNIEDSPQKAAKLAGFLYLLTTMTAIFGDFFVRGRLIVPGNAAQTATNIRASEQLFLTGIAGDLITIAAHAVLIVALLVVLMPVNRIVALVAGFWWFLECFLAAVNTSINYTTLLMVLKESGSTTLNGSQLGTFLLSLDMAGNRVAALFFGLGSTLFCYLWFRSRYIPRALAGWGILASLVPIIAPLTTMMVASNHFVPLRRARTGWPIITFHVIIGVWLVVKGIRAPKSDVATAQSGL